MNEPVGTTLSVRSTAQSTVAPDFVRLSGLLELRRPGKSIALTAVAEALQALTTELAELGGVPLARQTERSELTWSARSATTHPEHRYNKSSGEPEQTGNTVADVSVGIVVRDFARLPGLGAALARHEAFDLQATVWGVDEDNAAWSSIRADAIGAALRKGRDYADALGGRVVRIDHIADAGLLGSDTSDAEFRFPRAASLSGQADSAPTLDPVPQVLSATIDARLVAIIDEVPAIL